MHNPIKMRSFQGWVDTIGGILERCFVEGFLSNAQALQQDDDALQWAAFLHAWQAHYQANGVLSSLVARDITAGSMSDEKADDTQAGLYNALPDEISQI